ncbi:MAG TPA: alpha/beta fold hydrolase [Ktedonobacterales bacterium]|nr:alpha/beta fold hydrolase [Ktedonobacterales bacterium]
MNLMEKRHSQHQRASRLHTAVARDREAWSRWVSGALLLLSLVATACGTATRAPTPTAPPTIPVTPVNQSFTANQVTLSGTLYGHGPIALILSNQVENVSSEWGDVPMQFASRGFAVLTYQYRDTTDDTTRLSDLQAAIAFMQQQGAQKIVLMGASIGGLVTTVVATQTHVQAIVLLSAPDAYQTILLSAAQAQQITAPALIVESDEDEYLPDAQKIYGWLTAPKTLKIYPDDDSHGVALFANHDDLFPYVWQFLQRHDAIP